MTQEEYKFINDEAFRRYPTFVQDREIFRRGAEAFEYIVSEKLHGKELFKVVFAELQNHYPRLSMVGTIVCYDDKEKFNTEGFNFAYNLHRLTNLLNEQGEFK